MRNKVKNYKCAAKNNKAIANNKQVCDIVAVARSAFAEIITKVTTVEYKGRYIVAIMGNRAILCIFMYTLAQKQAYILTPQYKKNQHFNSMFIRFSLRFIDITSSRADCAL